MRHVLYHLAPGILILLFAVACIRLGAPHPLTFVGSFAIAVVWQKAWEKLGYE